MIAQCTREFETFVLCKRILPSTESDLDFSANVIVQFEKCQNFCHLNEKKELFLPNVDMKIH